MRRLKEGDKVTIKGGTTLDHNDQPIEVSGMTGTVADVSAYERQSTGENMVEVKLDRLHGGGNAYVADGRLQSGGRKVFGGLGGFFGRK